MPHSYGKRATTRHTFSRGFRNHGLINQSSYLRTYKIGDYVDIKVNGAVQKGMPHKYYHGKTGRVWNVTPRSIGVEVNKRVNTRIIKKRFHVRVEHIKPSKCNQDFLARRTENDRIRRDVKKGERTRPMKRIPEQPREGHFVSTRGLGVETITPVRYVLLV